MTESRIRVSSVPPLTQPLSCLPYNSSHPATSARDPMVTPDYKSFLQLSRDATLIPVAKTLSADLLTPVGAFLSVAAKQKYAFLLESVEGGEKIGRYTFVGAQPRMVLTARGQDLTIRRGSTEERRTGNVNDVLRETLRQYRPATVPGLPPFTSGGVGYFAYDMVRQFERLPETAKADVDLPDCIFTFYDRLLAFDHLKHQLHIIAAADVQCRVAAQGLRPRPGRHRCAGAQAGTRHSPAGTGMVGSRQAQGHQSAHQHFARRISRQRSPRQGVHCRRRHLPGRALAAARLQAASRAVPDLSRAAHRESVALHVLSAARRHARGRRVSGNAGAHHRTQPGVSPHRGHAAARRRSR